jgi:hypothetical protein
MEKKQIKLFLDDYRDPKHCVFYMYRVMGADVTIYSEEWSTVRNYEEFVKFVTENAGNLSHVSFDHDLADTHYSTPQLEWAANINGKEKTGYECALWFKDLYQELNLPLPTIFVHSMNPAGAERIKKVFNLI